MRTIKEIKAEKERIQCDERIKYPPANVFSNAPLALIQVELDTTVKVLKWVLNEKINGD